MKSPCQLSKHFFLKTEISHTKTTPPPHIPAIFLTYLCQHHVFWNTEASQKSLYLIICMCTVQPSPAKKKNNKNKTGGSSYSQNYDRRHLKTAGEFTGHDYSKSCGSNKALLVCESGRGEGWGEKTRKNWQIKGFCWWEHPATKKLQQPYNGQNVFIMNEWMDWWINEWTVFRPLFVKRLNLASDNID